jgi:hypothetical protein
MAFGVLYKRKGQFKRSRLNAGSKPGYQNRAEKVIQYIQNVHGHKDTYPLFILAKKSNDTYVATENVGDGILLGSWLRHDEGHGAEAERNHRRNSKDLLCGIR